MTKKARDTLKRFARGAGNFMSGDRYPFIAELEAAGLIVDQRPGIRGDLMKWVITPEGYAAVGRKPHPLCVWNALHPSDAAA
jgi:hypothetical protein